MSFFRTAHGYISSTHPHVDAFIGTANDWRGRLVAVFAHSSKMQERCPHTAFSPTYHRNEISLRSALQNLSGPEFQRLGDKFQKVQRAEYEAALAALKNPAAAKPAKPARGFYKIECFA